MKKVVFVLLLCIAFIILLSSCGSSNVIYQTPASINKFYASDTDANLTIFQYTWDGWGIKAKKINGELAELIQTNLTGMKETCDTENAISTIGLSEEFAAGPNYDCPAERGTYWIQTEDKIYRLSNDRKILCSVED